MVGLFILAVIGMLTFVSLLGSYTTVLEAFEIRLSVAIFDGGYTQLEIPPLGRVRARTHLPPLLLKTTLTNINLKQLDEVIANSRDEEYLAALQAAAYRKARIFLSRLLLLAFLGGVAGPYFFGERDRKKLLAAGVTGALLLLILLAGAYLTYSPAAFLSPEFEGILEAAPWMFGLVEEALFHVNSLGEQLELVAESINNLFLVVDRLEALGSVEGDLKVAHISDLHNNPAGMDFVRQVVQAFNVSLVIDTGDITDFGTEIEAGLATPIAGFGIPYVFIPGNHDTPDVVARMKSIPNVLVLEEGTVEIGGLRIAGIADPASAGPSMVVAPETELDRYALRLIKVVAAEEEAVHVACAHHPRIAEKSLGLVPVVLTGHTHQFALTERDGSVMINAGTTGAAGIRGLQTGKETPYTLALLHFGRREENGFYLKAVDIIHVYQQQSGFSLERRLFVQEAVAELQSEENVPQNQQ